MNEWLLSRRDRLIGPGGDRAIVARHEVPGSRWRERLRPGGTVEVIVSPTGIGRRNWAHAALETLVQPVQSSRLDGLFST